MPKNKKSLIPIDTIALAQLKIPLTTSGFTVRRTSEGQRYQEIYFKILSPNYLGIEIKHFIPLASPKDVVEKDSHSAYTKVKWRKNYITLPALTWQKKIEMRETSFTKDIVKEDEEKMDRTDDYTYLQNLKCLVYIHQDNHFWEVLSTGKTDKPSKNFIKFIIAKTSPKISIFQSIIDGGEARLFPKKTLLEDFYY